VASEDGAALAEFAIVLPIFLLLFFTLLEFGRLGGEYVMADKAMQRAARIAAVRPPACGALPTFNARGSVPAGTTPPKYGTYCSAGSSICVSPAAATCTGVAGDPTVDEIWLAISPMLPPSATEQNLRFGYSYDPALNFLGGPYVPNVTVELTGLTFQFVVPLGPLANLAGATGTMPPNSVPFPAMRTTLPGEDLDQGNNG
jgi:hypothetical protein